MLEILGHRIGHAIRRQRLALMVRLRFVQGRWRGDFTAAEEVCRRLLSIDGRSFVARIHLGLIQSARGRREAALFELSLAQALDPSRFRRARIPEELRRAVLWRSDLRRVEAPPAVEHVEPRGSRRSGEAATRSQTASRPSAAQETLAAADLDGSDFSTVEELRRLIEMPPITAEEIASVDLDALADRLQRG